MAASLLTYAYMASASYGGDQNEVWTKFREDPTHGDWNIALYQVGTPANGFQGAVFESDDEVVCAYKGSKGGMRDKTTTGYDDWSVNDVQIALNQVPNQVTPATAFVQQAEQIAGVRPVTLVGHSLGGGLAQFVGYTEQLPFITFNAPGMKNNIPGAVVKGQARGFNMILASDPVGNAGKHLGKTERFMTISMFNPFGGAANFAHVMKNVIATLKMHKNATWAAKKLAQLI